MPRLFPVIYSPDDYLKGANRLAGYINVGTVEDKKELLNRLRDYFKGQSNIDATIRSGKGTVYQMLLDLWKDQVQPRVQKELPLERISVKERVRQLNEIRRRRRIGRQQAIQWFTFTGAIRERTMKDGSKRKYILHKDRYHRLDKIVAYHNSKYNLYITRRKPKRRKRS